MTAPVSWWGDENHPCDREIAASLNLAWRDTQPTTGFYLRRDADGVALFRAGMNNNDRPIRADLLSAAATDRAGKRSLLARACGLHRHPPGDVIDATAGLGRDSAVLAQLGCTITAFERNPVVYALLADAHRRLQARAPDWSSNWPTVEHDDAVATLSNKSDAGPSIILLDPMFAPRRRRASPQKSMAWLAEIAGSDLDADRLLACARAAARQRVVVKRHARSPSLVLPDVQFHGKAVRFDVYLSGPGL